MTKIQMIKQLINGKKPLVDVYHYLLGNYRYFLWYNEGFFNLKFIREHIWEQINYRIRVMKPECYNSGSCVVCGCATTALQMANKGCDGYCYPEIMGKKHWQLFKNCGSYIGKNGIWIYDRQTDRHILYEETTHSFKPKTLIK